ncbi:MAG: aminotransferase class I/II-fold pyridoxal phosphate-dependent enzyme [Chitinophagaceae bacterium]
MVHSVWMEQLPNWIRSVELADKYDAIIMIDECHSSGFLGKTGRGTHEYRGVMGRIDIITGTLGKALGWSQSGGFTSGSKEKSLICCVRNLDLIYSVIHWPLLSWGHLLRCWIC